MSSILSAMRERLNELHRQERTLAEYILENAPDVVRLAIGELAERSGTSPATVSRFCRTFRFDGYAEFKMKLAAELAQPPSPDQYQDIVSGNPVADIITSVEANYRQAVSETSIMLDPLQLKRAVDAILAAGRIDIYGVATSGVVAQDFYQKLVRIGLRASTFSDSHMQITSASTLTRGDTAIGISYSGETDETLDALLCAKDRGATVISITKYGPNRLAAAADIPLFSSALEEGLRRGDMASRIGQLMVLDILFTALLSERFHDYVPRLEESFAMVNKYRKSPKH